MQILKPIPYSLGKERVVTITEGKTDAYKYSGWQIWGGEVSEARRAPLVGVTGRSACVCVSAAVPGLLEKRRVLERSRNSAATLNLRFKKLA